MATAKEQIDQLSTKVDGLSTVTADVAADFAAFRDAVAADRENLSESGQAALDAANAKLDAAYSRLQDLDVSVGDADGSDVQPGTTPGGDEPAEGGVDGTPTDGTTPVEDTAPAGEGSDLSVDAPVNPEDSDAPRPTS